jgi:hypothetical protein
MEYSRISNLVLTALLAITCGCQSTTAFKITPLGYDDIQVVEIDRNRIIHECYFMNAEAENNWRHQYILYILNEKNEVIPVFYPTNQGKAECMAHLKKVERILRNAERLKLCVHDPLEWYDDSKFALELHDFGSLGKHSSPYNALRFDRICSSKECYRLEDVYSRTCPTFKF